MDNNEIDKLNYEAWNIRRKDLRSAFDTGINLKKLSESTNYLKGIADSCRILGYCYWRFADYSLSLSNSIRAIDIYRNLNDKKGEADALNSIGAVYMFQKNHAKRLDCNMRCYDIRKEIGDLQGVAASENNIGETYLDMGEMEQAEQWFDKCKNNSNTNNQIRAWAIHNLAKVSRHKNLLDVSCKAYRECLSITNKVGYDILTAETHLELTSFFIELKKYEKAQKEVQLALNTAKKIGAKGEIERALFYLAQIAELTCNYKLSLEMYKQYNIVHEDIFNEVKEQQIKDIGFQHEINKISKEAEIERLKSLELKKAYDKIESQKQMIENKNRELVDSIIYAQHIQHAILSKLQILKDSGLEYFVLYRPKDIVSGDFYWFYRIEDVVYIVVADCTGHGVPGAFLTMLGNTYLNEIIALGNPLLPNLILDQLRTKVVQRINENEHRRDGMDISIARIELNKRILNWSGAMNPLWIVRKNDLEFTLVEPDRQSICYTEYPELFKNHEISLNKGDVFYLFSDGYADQFGGPHNKKFRQKQLMDLLLSQKNKPMSSQAKVLEKRFDQWKGELEQVDDVCLIGIRV